MAKISGLTDAMSDVLSLVRMQGDVVCLGLYAAPWSLGFDLPFAHFHMVQRGSARLRLDDGTVLRLEPGDLVLLPLGHGHTLSSDVSLPPVPITTAIARPGAMVAGIHRIDGPGETTEVICGRFSFAGVLAPRLLKVLPRLIHIEARQSRPLDWLRRISEALISETQEPKPGSAIMVERLLDLMFIQVIRHWAAAHPRNLGWMSGLRDAQIGRALSAIHADPAQDWTVAELAGKASLSRSAFAARFVEVVGQTPLRYLTTWRLDLASDQLRSGTLAISQIAQAVGYGSEAALTRAFKAQFGTTPAAYRRGG